MSFCYDMNEYVPTTWTLEHMPLQEALDIFHRQGFSEVEIWADTVHLDPRANPDIGQVKKWLKEYGLKVHSVHAPFRNYKDRPASEEDFLALRIQMLEKTIQYAQALECPMMVLHAVDRKEYNYPMAQLETVQEYVGRAVSYGANRGVRIAIEDVPPGGEPGEIYTTLENQKKLFQGLDIGFCLDIGHVPLLGADLYREVDAAGDRLITLHVHNNSGASDDHNLPTDGIIDGPALHDYIREKGYRGKFVLEIYGGPDRQRELEVVQGISGLFGK